MSTIKMSTIIQPISNYVGKKVSTTSFAKLGLYTGVATLSSLGFYRGCQQYHFSKTIIENKEFVLSDYAYCSIFGLIGASTYVNPTFSGFAIYHEYLRLRMLLDGEDSKKISESNILFNLCGRKQV